MQNGFQKLEVWQKAHTFVLLLYELTNNFPESEKFSLTTQIRRSASSICANLAEGYKKSTKDFIRYVDIAQGSLEETKYHLLLSKDLGYYRSSAYQEFIIRSDEIGKMLTALRKYLRSRI